MSRTRLFLSLLIPAVIATGAIATTATITRADDDDDIEEAQREAEEAQREAEEAQREAERAQQRAHDAAQRAGERAQRNAGKQAAKAAKGAVKQARKEARQQIEQARKAVEQAPMPEKLRKKILARLDRAAQIVDEHLANASNTDDMDDFEREMEAMGEVLEAEMEAMAEELAEMGEDWAQMGAHGAWTFDPDSNDPQIYVVPPTAPVPPVPPVPRVAPVAPVPPVAPVAPSPYDVDVDIGDLDIVIDVDVQDLALTDAQLDELDVIFQTEQDVIEPARERLEDLSQELRDALASDSLDEDQLATLVDSISAQEAKIRKAQIMAWAKSKKLLDAKQRDRVEKAKVKVKKGRRVR